MVEVLQGSVYFLHYVRTYNLLQNHASRVNDTFMESCLYFERTEACTHSISPIKE